MAVTSTRDIVWGWSQSLSLRRAHYVPTGAPVWDHHGRPVGTALCGWPGLVDQNGHDTAMTGMCTACHQCRRRLAGECLDCGGTGEQETSTTVAPGVTSYAVVPCVPCGGTGHLPPVPRAGH
jgi:hypothetical protein